MSVSLKGLQSGDSTEERAIALLEVVHNNQTYDWILYIPQNVNLSEYIESKTQDIYNDIDKKELEWQNLSPKTKEIVSPESNEVIVVNIEKSEVVKPDFPDYYAKRKKEYPSLGDQLDALWKGGDAVTNMLNKINEVKNRYPKS